MDRREFLMTGAALSTVAALFSGSLLAESAKRENAGRFSLPLEPIIKGGVKEYHLFIDIYQQEIVPSFKIHTLAFNNQVPGPEHRAGVWLAGP